MADPAPPPPAAPPHVPGPEMPAKPSAAYAAPEARKQCDLVMKGGITSGVVYPPAVLQLAEKYTFRGIGGASAGAIAAAATAAAEYARETGGFDRLKTVMQELVAPRFLRDLFQPTRRTRPAFDFLIGLQEASTGSGSVRFLFRTAFVRAGLLFLLGLVVTAAVLGVFDVRAGRLFDYTDSGVAWRVLVLLFAPLLLSMVLTPVTFLLQFRRFRMAVRDDEHFFGMCPGLAAPGHGEALTDYLHRTIDDLADRADGPLTFGHLKEKKIELALMTSNLSLQRPYRFPLPPTEVYFFKAAELRRLFPGPVVQAMIAGGAARATADPRLAPYAVAAGEDLHLLPAGDDLPVVVAVRISLGFPLLFSAVPLYALTQEYFDRLAAGGPAAQVRAADVKRHYFSDGGIVSNFPIHMFDVWLPSSPTFGINLADVPGAGGGEVEPAYLARTTLLREAGAPALHPAVEPGGGHPERKPVYLPRADAQPVDEWRAVGGLANLASAVFYTAKNHHENQQSVLPSYKERIVTVRLREDQGGLNLNMPTAVIEEVIELGRQAGDVLAKKFELNHHRWIRLQVVLARLVDELKSAVRVLERERDCEDLLRAASDAFPWWTRQPDWPGRTRDWLKTFREEVQKLLATAPEFDDELTPTPKPEKRLVPRL